MSGRIVTENDANVRFGVSLRLTLLKPGPGSMQTDFDELIAEHSGRIRAIVHRYASAEAQEDLYQDILMQLWRSFPGFRGDSRVETWI